MQCWFRLHAVDRLKQLSRVAVPVFFNVRTGRDTTFCSLQHTGLLFAKETLSWPSAEITVGSELKSATCKPQSRHGSSEVEGAHRSVFLLF